MNVRPLRDTAFSNAKARIERIERMINEMRAKDGDDWHYRHFDKILDIEGDEKISDVEIANGYKKKREELLDTIAKAELELTTLDSVWYRYYVD